MTKRAKKVIHTGITSEQMESAMGEYASADAKLAKINATMDEQITKIRAKYADDVAELTETKDKNFEIVQAFAMENREELFVKKKSMESAHGTIGFRTGTPKLKTLKSFTWGAVTQLLKKFMPDYVRITEEPAKDKLLADRDLPGIIEALPEMGIAVVQDETFYIELKKEDAAV